MKTAYDENDIIGFTSSESVGGGLSETQDIVGIVITVAEFAVNNRGSNGTSSCAIEKRADTAKFTSNDRSNSSIQRELRPGRKGKTWCSIRDEAKIASRVGGVK